MASLTVSAAEKKRHELQKKLKERKGDDVPSLTSEEITALTTERLEQIKTEEARLEKKGPWDENTKSFKAAIGDDSVKAAPIKLCKAVNLETEGSMNNAEKAKLAAMVRLSGLQLTFSIFPVRLLLTLSTIYQNFLLPYRWATPTHSQ